MRNNMSTKESRRFSSNGDFPSQNGESVERNVEWLGGDSNTRHEDFQSSALPTELPSRLRGCVTKNHLIAWGHKHGHTNAKGYLSPTYISWQRMKQRCQYKKHRSYRYYGGRGIKVCDRWQKFESFLQDMGERPLGKTLDRIDVDGDYGPENCRWATDSEQELNKRRAA